MNLIEKYRVIFENEFLFTNIIQLYMVCKHGDECRVHYNSVCMENVIGGILFQPEGSEYLQNCTFDTATGNVTLNPVIECLHERHRYKITKWMPRARCAKKLNCNFIMIPAANTLELIDILYRIICESNFFREYDRHFVEYINKEYMYNRKTFCKKYFRTSLS